MPRKWYDSRVIRIEDMSPTTKQFWVEIDEVTQFDFRPGQFVTMDLPIHEKRNKRWRSYSIANHPDQNNVLAFSIVYLEGGAASQYFFEEVAIGTTLKFKGPAGVFVLPEIIDHKMVMICTGTGVAPFRSMIWDAYHRQQAHQGMHLIFGTRTAEGILYQAEFEQLAKEWPDFRYDIALSRQADWDGYKGYVHQIYQEHYPVNDPNTHFYLCGWTNMVDEAVLYLTETLGCDRKQVHFELYG